MNKNEDLTKQIKLMSVAEMNDLAAEIKKAGRQAIHTGGVLQILFGVMGRRWDGSRFGGLDKMPEGLKKYYNDAWIYPLEGKPKEAGKVEYGPYWN